MPDRSDKILLLVDGNSIINRSFFAMAGRNNLTAPDGTPTAALNTYLNTLKKYMDELRPTHIATLFDRKEKTFRHEMYDGYKAKRKGMPDDLAVQMPLLKETLDAMRLKRVEMPGFEADDLIGTFARKAENEGFTVYILSGDKDDFQLIDEHTSVVMPVTKSGKSQTEIYDAAALKERYFVTPDEFVTLKAIMGDNSDNIPGVKGIGEKGAVELVTTYKSLDEIYKNLDALAPGLQKKLSENRDMAYLSLELSRIRCDAPVSETLEDFRVIEPDRSRLTELFRRLGFRSQIGKWGGEEISFSNLSDATTSVSDDEEIPPLQRPTDIASWKSLFLAEAAKGDLRISLEVTTWQKKTDAFEFIVAIDGLGIFAFSSDQTKEVIQILASYFEDQADIETGISPIGCGIKQRFGILSEALPFRSVFDVEIAGYLLNQIEGTTPSFEMIYEHALRRPFPERVDPTAAKNRKASRSEQTDLEMLLSGDETAKKDEIDPSVSEDAARRAWRSLQIAEAQKQEVKEQNLETLFYTIEMPLVLHLDRMERIGVHVDESVLNEIHDFFAGETVRLSERIYSEAGKKFNILSPKQLGEVLFVEMKLPSGRKNSTGGYSTDSDELNRLLHEHPIVSLILDYRQISKLDSTFVLGLKKMIDPSDGRVHSSFSQAVTNTGRLSSSEPNLQNIPIRSELGSQIRKAFTSPKGSILLDADYSQIELRLLAHLSGDENMINAFLNREDIHMNTAMKIFNVSRENVTPSMRSAAKTVNFSIVYGISDFGLSQDLGISFQEAHQYIENYYRQYPGIRAYLDSLKHAANVNGYVETLYGRRRIMNELKSANRNIRMFGERAAMNTPVQGTAADIIKIAMNQVTHALDERKLSAHLILQVHDELIIESKEDEREEAAAVLKDAMESAATLKVPLIAEVSAGYSWYSCKNG